MTTISIELPTETEKRLREKARTHGQSLEDYIVNTLDGRERLIDDSPAKRRVPFAEFVAPIANAVKESGMTDDEIGDFLSNRSKKFEPNGVKNGLG